MSIKSDRWIRRMSQAPGESGISLPAAKKLVLRALTRVVQILERFLEMACGDGVVKYPDIAANHLANA